MSTKKRTIEHTVRRESAQRKEGVRKEGAAAPAVIRTPMVRGQAARKAQIVEMLRREGVI